MGYLASPTRKMWGVGGGGGSPKTRFQGPGSI